jgi:hypothetical protein
MLILGARPLGLRQCHGGRGDLRLELPNVELRRETLAESLARDLQRRASRAQCSFGDRALLVQLEELEVARDDVADERQHHGTMSSLARRVVGVRRLDSTAHAPPKIELPREIAGKPRRSKRRGGESSGRDLIAALRRVQRHVRQQRRARDTDVGAELVHSRDRELHVSIVLHRPVDEIDEGRVRNDLEPRGRVERCVADRLAACG